MIEIIVLPYMAISFAIGWAVFSPFGNMESPENLIDTQVGIGDLLALLFPLSLLFSVAGLALDHSFSFLLRGLVAASIVVFAGLSFVASLWLVARLEQPDSLRRATIIGVITPFGILLAVFWVVIPGVACVSSPLLAIPATVAIGVVSLILRTVSAWVCRTCPLG